MGLMTESVLTLVLLSFGVVAFAVIVRFLLVFPHESVNPTPGFLFRYMTLHPYKT